MGLLYGRKLCGACAAANPLGERQEENSMATVTESARGKTKFEVVILTRRRSDDDDGAVAAAASPGPSSGW